MKEAEEERERSNESDRKKGRQQQEDEREEKEKEEQEKQKKKSRKRGKTKQENIRTMMADHMLKPQNLRQITCLNHPKANLAKKASFCRKKPF